MAEQPDNTEAAGVFQKAMEAALANLDKVGEDARKAHEEAIDLQIAAKAEISRIEREAEVISRDFVDKHRKELLNDLSDNLLRSMLKKLILHGISSIDLLKVLEFSREMLAKVLEDIGFSKLGEHHVAHVSYEEQGRAGDIIFYREDIMLRFWYEFGINNTLAFISIPSEIHWKQITGLPVEDRLPILHFIGERVVRDRAQGYKYEITEEYINIKSQSKQTKTK